MPSLRHDLQNHGFLLRASRLRELGHSRREIDAAIADGWLTRPVRPWLATTDAERDAVIAILHRGRLTSASALGSMGVWRGLDRSIHVLVDPHSAGGRSRIAVPLAEFAQPRHPTHGVIRHWGCAHMGSNLDWRVSAVDALAAFARDTTPEQLVAAVDSALHTRALRPVDVPLLAALLPLRLRTVLRDIDGRAESGTESIVRLRLAPLGRTVEIQVEIGPYRVDLLIDGWLVIEIDSEEWHSSTRVEDLTKSTWLTAQGYRVEHFDYSQVTAAWSTVEAAIRQALGQQQPAPRSARR